MHEVFPALLVEMRKISAHLAGKEIAVEPVTENEGKDQIKASLQSLKSYSMSLRDNPEEEKREEDQDKKVG